MSGRPATPSILVFALLVWSARAPADTTTCSCTGDATAFRACVKQAIDGLSGREKRSAAARRLKRDVRKSSCGRTKGPRKAVACCVRESAGGIVVDPLCLPVSGKTCTKLRGRQRLGGTNSCFPTNPCGG